MSSLTLLFGDGLNAVDSAVRPWMPKRANAGDGFLNEEIIGSDFIDYIAGGAGDDVIDSQNSFVPSGFNKVCHFLYMSKESNQRKHIPQSSPLGSLAFDKKNRSALCHFPVTRRLKPTSCCLNPLLLSTLGLIEGKMAA